MRFGIITRRYHLHGAGQPGVLPPVVPSPGGIAFKAFPVLPPFLNAAAEISNVGHFPGEYVALMLITMSLLPWHNLANSELLK